ncbi:MAG: glycosyltransferase [Planctomycetes bacterium]|nr:glycosyltransferase [Planctomycetota bacterium]
MRILAIDEEVGIPPDTGKKLRSFHLLRETAHLHEITCIAYADAATDAEAIRAYESAGIRVAPVPRVTVRKRGAGLLFSFARNLLQRAPFSAAAYDTPRFRDAVRRAGSDGGFDLLHCELTTFAHLAREAAGMPLVIDAHNVEAILLERMAGVAGNPLKKIAVRMQARKMDRFEREHYPAFDLVCCVSDIDRAALLERYGLAHVEVVANGVDIDALRPRDEPPRPGSLLFTGSLDWRPNQDALAFFLEKVFPILRARDASLTFTAAGRRPPEWLRSRIAGTPGAALLADVPDMREPLARAAVVVVPLRIGGGSRLKILDAFAMGKAVVSTTLGAEGLEVVDGEHIVLADEPAAFADAVLAVLRDGERAASLGRAGRALAEARYSWRAIGRRLSDLWIRTAARRGS